MKRHPETLIATYRYFETTDSGKQQRVTVACFRGNPTTADLKEVARAYRQPVRIEVIDPLMLDIITGKVLIPQTRGLFLFQLLQEIPKHE